MTEKAYHSASIEKMVDHCITLQMNRDRMLGMKEQLDQLQQKENELIDTLEHLVLDMGVPFQKTIVCSSVLLTVHPDDNPDRVGPWLQVEFVMPHYELPKYPEPARNGAEGPMQEAA